MEREIAERKAPSLNVSVLPIKQNRPRWLAGHIQDEEASPTQQSVGQTGPIKQELQTPSGARSG